MRNYRTKVEYDAITGEKYTRRIYEWTRIRPISKKRAEADKLYRKAVRRWWKLRCLIWIGNPMCEVTGCCRKADKTPHHILPRSVRPDLVAVVYNFLAVCRWCHSKIHANPKWAREQGYMGRSTDKLEELAARRLRQ